MKTVMRHNFYKSLGRVLAPGKNSEEQLEAAMGMMSELMALEISPKVQKFFLMARTKPWMYDVFNLIKERKEKDAYEQRETKSASRRQGYIDPAAEFFDLVKGHDGT
jgi:hypothetical protein